MTSVFVCRAKIHSNTHTQIYKLFCWHPHKAERVSAMHSLVEPECVVCFFCAILFSFLHFFFVSLEKISLQLEPNIIIIFRVRTFVFQVPFTFRITCVLCAADSRCLWIGTHIRSISIRPCDYLNTLLEWVAKGKFNLHLVCRYVCQNLRKETRNGLIEKCENKFKSIALTKAIRPKTLW